MTFAYSCCQNESPGANLSGGTRISSYFSSFYVSRATRVFRVFLTHWDHGQALLKIAKKYVVKKLEKITVNDVFVFILQLNQLSIQLAYQSKTSGTQK